jgi:hypothetical protein
MRRAPAAAAARLRRPAVPAGLGLGRWGRGAPIAPRRRAQARGGVPQGGAPGAQPVHHHGAAAHGGARQGPRRERVRRLPGHAAQRRRRGLPAQLGRGEQGAAERWGGGGRWHVRGGRGAAGAGGGGGVAQLPPCTGPGPCPAPPAAAASRADPPSPAARRALGATQQAPRSRTPTAATPRACSSARWRPCWRAGATSGPPAPPATTTPSGAPPLWCRAARSTSTRRTGSPAPSRWAPVRLRGERAPRLAQRGALPAQAACHDRADYAVLRLLSDGQSAHRGPPPPRPASAPQLLRACRRAPAGGL